jgi:Spy/CpxP family protein refolding chaperone
MNRFLYFTGAVLLIVAVGFGIARAEFGTTQHSWGWHHGPGGFPAAYIAHELNLTDAQESQIKVLWAAERPAVAPLLRQVLDGCNEMASANSNGNFDENKTRAIADKQAVTVSQLLVERQRLISKIYNEVLTPEQRVKADQLRERMHGRIEGFLDHMDHPTE